MSDIEGMKKAAKEMREKYNKFVKWMLRWRGKFDIKAGSKADKTIAYVIDKVYDEHRFRWKHLLRKIEQEALKHKESNKHLAFLALLAESHQARVLSERVSDETKNVKDKKPEYLLDMETRLKGFRTFVGNYKEMLQGKRKVEIEEPINLPNWYNVASGEYLKKEGVNEEDDIEEDVEELNNISSLKEIIKARSNQAFAKFCYVDFGKMRELINKEIELRREVIGSSDPKEALKLLDKIKKKVEEQRDTWKEYNESKYLEARSYLNDDERKKCDEHNKKVTGLIKEHLEELNKKRS